MQLKDELSNKTGAIIRRDILRNLSRGELPKASNRNHGPTLDKETKAIITIKIIVNNVLE